MPTNNQPVRYGSSTTTRLPGGVHFGKVTRKFSDGTVNVSVRFLNATIGPCRVVCASLIDVDDSVLVAFTDNKLSELVVIGKGEMQVIDGGSA